MTTVGDIISAMHRWAPPVLAEDWDNTGLMTGDPGRSVTHILITLDVTTETVAAAHRLGAEMVVSHHPPIFRPIRSLAGYDHATRVIIEAVRADIALFAAHTNLDQVPDGVSGSLAHTLGIEGVLPLVPGRGDLLKFITFVPPSHTDAVIDAASSAGAGVIGAYRACSFSVRGTGTFLPGDSAQPYTGHPGELTRTEEDRIEMIVPAHAVDNVVAAAQAAHPYEEMAWDLVPLAKKDPAIGYGAIGTLPRPMTPEEFAAHVCRSLNLAAVTWTPGPSDTIHKVAVMGGNGSGSIVPACTAGADAYVTGDIGHHDFIDHGEAICLIDATHRATELPVLDAIRNRLSDEPGLSGIELTINQGSEPCTVFSPPAHGN